METVQACARYPRLNIFMQTGTANSHGIPERARSAGKNIFVGFQPTCSFFLTIS
jgi:hypothetical protein